MEGLPDVPRHRATRAASCRRPSSTSASPSTATTLTGTPEQRERWKRAVAATNDALGEAVGKLYVAQYFPPAEKARAEAMVTNILAAFARRIDKLDVDGAGDQGRRPRRSSPRSRSASAIPTSGATTRGSRSCAATRSATRERAALFEYQRNLAKLGQPVDRGEWVMKPQMVNAVNLPAMNALNFPAAILQPPFFDPARPGGRWTTARSARSSATRSATASTTRARCSTPTASCRTGGPRRTSRTSRRRRRSWPSSSTPTSRSPTLHVNGKLTLEREHRRRRRARRRVRRLSHVARRQGGAEAQGLTGDQQFFISFAQSWRTKIREAAARSAPAHRRPRAGGVPRRHGAQPRRLVRGVRRQAGPEALPGARRARARLVRRATTARRGRRRDRPCRRR